MVNLRISVALIGHYYITPFSSFFALYLLYIIILYYNDIDASFEIFPSHL